MCVLVYVAASATASREPGVDDDPGPGTSNTHPSHLCHQAVPRGRQGKEVGLWWVCFDACLHTVTPHRSCCTVLAWRRVALEMTRQRASAVFLTCSEIGVCY